jgi:rubrerythrin
MDELALAEALRKVINEEQDLYRRYLMLVDETDDLELKEIFGHHAFEQFTHLNTIIEKYKDMVDGLRREGQL